MILVTHHFLNNDRDVAISLPPTILKDILLPLPSSINPSRSINKPTIGYGKKAGR